MRATSSAILAIAIIGFLDSLYLSWAAWTGSSIACGILEGCNIVAQSPYSRVLGIPLATWGLVYYIGVLGLAGCLLFAPSRAATLLMVLYAILGVLFSAYFLYLQAFVIGAFCIYCLISAAATLALLCLSVWHRRRATL